MVLLAQPIWLNVRQYAVKKKVAYVQTLSLTKEKGISYTFKGKKSICVASGCRPGTSMISGKEERNYW